jgi:hypothetical protein
MESQKFGLFSKFLLSCQHTATYWSCCKYVTMFQCLVLNWRADSITIFSLITQACYFICKWYLNHSATRDSTANSKGMDWGLWVDIWGLSTWNLFKNCSWVKKQRPLKTVPTGARTGMELTQQPMDPLCKGLAGFLLKPLNYCSLDLFIYKTYVLLHFLEISHIVIGLSSVEDGPTPSSIWKAYPEQCKPHGDRHCCSTW